MNIESQNLEKIQLLRKYTDIYNNSTFQRMLQSSPTMKREIQNASYMPFIDNESISLTMSVSTYFEMGSILWNVPLNGFYTTISQKKDFIPIKKAYFTNWGDIQAYLPDIRGTTIWKSSMPV